MTQKMPKTRSPAADFRRMMKWIVLVAILTVAGALWFAAATSDLTVNMAVAMTGGVFLSVTVGSGLFALAFFSDKSGYDQTVTDASKQRDSAEDV